MEKKTILIASSVFVGGAIAVVGTLGYLGSQSNERVEDAIGQQSLEESYVKELSDGKRYTFCQSHEEISGPFTSSVFGEEKGTLSYTSDDINVFDKQKNALYILGREMRYSYSGVGAVAMGPGAGNVRIEESGMTVEYFDLFSAPMRIDYRTRMIFPAPERKKNDWVVIERTGIGAVLGYAEEGKDSSLGDAKTFCAPFSVDKAFSSPEYLSIEHSCDTGDGGPFRFSGTFTFSCGGVDNEKGIALVKEYQLRESGRSLLDTASVQDGTSENEFQHIIQENMEDDVSTQVKLERMREEMRGEGIH
jgi:hypothetical protein